MNNELEAMWKEEPLLSLRYFADICLDGRTKKKRQNNWSKFVPSLPKYSAGILATKLAAFSWFHCGQENNIVTCISDCGRGLDWWIDLLGTHKS
jgi:hypothetical protein